MLAISDWLEIIGDSEELVLSPTELVHLRADLQRAQVMISDSAALIKEQRQTIARLSNIVESYKSSAEQCAAVAREAIAQAKSAAA